MISLKKMIQMTMLLSEKVLLGPLYRHGFPSGLQEPKGQKAIPKVFWEENSGTVFEVIINFLCVTFLFNSLKDLELHIQMLKDSYCSSTHTQLQHLGRLMKQKSEFIFSLGYIVRSCFKILKKCVREFKQYY